MARARAPLVTASIWCILLGWASFAAGQGGTRPLYRTSDPPGMITSQQRAALPALSHHVQPVQLVVPQGSWIAVATGGGFTSPAADTLNIGIQAGTPYRLHVTWILPNRQYDIYPTLELIDRVYAEGERLARFPIPVHITVDDLQQAAAGHLVTKVIYVEDPDLPLRDTGGEQPWFDVRPNEDPLEVADSLGRPVAILRLGSRIPRPDGPDAAFLFGSPPVVVYATAPAEPQETAQAEPRQASGERGVFVQLNDETSRP